MPTNWKAKGYDALCEFFLGQRETDPRQSDEFAFKPEVKRKHATQISRKGNKQGEPREKKPKQTNHANATLACNANTRRDSIEATLVCICISLYEYCCMKQTLCAVCIYICSFPVDLAGSGYLTRS